MCPMGDRLTFSFGGWNQVQEPDPGEKKECKVKYRY